MKIVAAVNVYGDQWELTTEGDASRMFMACDRIVSAPGDGLPLDTGSALVHYVGRYSLHVESGSTGWVPNVGHVIGRAQTCGCPCHRTWRIGGV